MCQNISLYPITMYSYSVLINNKIKRGKCIHAYSDRPQKRSQRQPKGKPGKKQEREKRLLLGTPQAWEGQHSSRPSDLPSQLCNLRPRPAQRQLSDLLCAVQN